MTAPSPIRIAHALQARYDALPFERGDEAHLHVADLSKCPREVWARRNGHPLLPFPLETRRKFRLGILVEDDIVQALDYAYASHYTIRRDALVWLDLDGHGRLIGGVFEDPGAVDAFCAAHPGAVIGHPDALCEPKDRALGLPRVLIEVKSTLFFERMNASGRREREPDVTPQQQYIIQTAGYGLATEADEALIAVSCIHSQKVSPENAAYRFKPQRYKGLITGLVSQYARLTALGTPMPAPEPPEFGRRARPKPGQAENWLCDFCRFAACERNNNPQRLEVSV